MIISRSGTANGWGVRMTVDRIFLFIWFWWALPPARFWWPRRRCRLCHQTVLLDLNRGRPVSRRRDLFTGRTAPGRMLTMGARLAGFVFELLLWWLFRLSPARRCVFSNFVRGISFAVGPVRRSETVAGHIPSRHVGATGTGACRIKLDVAARPGWWFPPAGIRNLIAINTTNAL